MNKSPFQLNLGPLTAPVLKRYRIESSGTIWEGRFPRKFAFGYYFDKRKGISFRELAEQYAPFLHEVYFPWPGLLSARVLSGISPALRKQLIDDLRFCRSKGMKLDLLANATCYGDKAFVSEQKLDFFANLDEMKNAGVMPEIITTTSPYLAVIARRYSRDIERRASVNMRLNSTLAMEYVSREFDSFYICRDLQRDLPTVKMFAEWGKRNGKTICMLANSGCLRYCPWQTFHETLLAHRSMSDPAGEQRKGNEEAKRIGLPATLCLDICRNKRFEEILRGSWIRPEDLHLYEPYFSVIKLSTREADRPDLILKAYISGSHDGDLLQILDPDFSGFVAPNIFDNKSFPPEWSGGTIAGLCASNCTHCGKCAEVMELVFKRDPNRTVRPSYSFAPEEQLKTPGC